MFTIFLFAFLLAIFWFQPIDCENEEQTNERKKGASNKKTIFCSVIWMSSDCMLWQSVDARAWRNDSAVVVMMLQVQVCLLFNVIKSRKKHAQVSISDHLNIEFLVNENLFDWDFLDGWMYVVVSWEICGKTLNSL